jgi:hypothetical protein
MTVTAHRPHYNRYGGVARSPSACFHPQVSKGHAAFAGELEGCAHLRHVTLKS